MTTKKEPIYPIEQWSVTETCFDIANIYRNETAFALSNGYIGTRGTFEEGYGFSVDEGLEGNFINGFYESEDIRYGEWNFGFPEKSQSLLNLPNLKTTRVYAGGELFDMRVGTVEAGTYKRSLNMKAGRVVRELIWTSPGGVKIRLETVRLVSLPRKNIMAQRIRVTPINYNGSLIFESRLDGDVENHTRKTNPLVDYGPFGKRLLCERAGSDGDYLFYRGKTAGSGLTMACGSLHVMGATESVRSERFLTLSDSADSVSPADSANMSISYETRCREGVSVTFDKFIAYTSCLDTPEEELDPFIKEELRRAAADGFDTLCDEQSIYMKSFWDAADVRVEGDDAISQGLRFNLFHVMQSAGRDGRTGMGAKGLSGEGYEGHYFWDTEVYVMPVFTHTFPELSKNLLDYRWHTLDEARERARTLGHQSGALYPWRTINGQEASTYMPLGTAQYHINADVAYAFWQYVNVSGDFQYLKDRAAEVLCETARVWADVGCFSEARGGKYCICCVTGPDEYTAFVDNNFYTNLMARENIRAAICAVDWLLTHDCAAYTALSGKIGLREDEITQWQRIADNMYLPYDEVNSVFLQDDGMLMRKEWDDTKIPPNKRHLLYENYHPLFLWRQRMAKQADSMLAMYLHSNLFTPEEIRRNYDYYQKITLHHSSLSTCVFGILASGIGYEDEAYKFFCESARMDIDDYHNNFYAGIHAANMAGTWLAIVHGFAGLRAGNGNGLTPGLSLSPTLPAAWKGYTFRVLYRGSRLEIEVSLGSAKVRLLSGGPVSLLICGDAHILNREGDLVSENI